MRTFFPRKAMLPLLACFLLPALAFAADAKEVLAKARGSYYVLQEQGLKSFSCDVGLDWPKFLESVDKKPVAKDDPRLKKFEVLRFKVAVNEKGDAAITPYMTGGGEIDPSLNEMISGLKQMLSGFYETWTAIVLTNPFPQTYDSGLTLRQEGENYRFISPGNEMVLTKDFAIAEMKVELPGTLVLSHPTFEKTAKGFLLTSIDSDINNGAQKVLIVVHHQAVQGLQLPDLASFKVAMPGQVYTIEVAFSKYEVSKK